jgi:hypothetical protein
VPINESVYPPELRSDLRTTTLDPRDLAVVTDALAVGRRPAEAGHLLATEWLRVGHVVSSRSPRSSHAVVARGYGPPMIVHHLEGITAAEFAEGTGWIPKTEGLCRGEICVPAPGTLRSDGTVDVTAAGRRLGMPFVADTVHDVAAIGPATVGGHALATAEAADPELLTRDGNPFRLSAFHGRKVLLVAWASY